MRQSIDIHNQNSGAGWNSIFPIPPSSCHKVEERLTWHLALPSEKRKPIRIQETPFFHSISCRRWNIVTEICVRAQTKPGIKNFNTGSNFGTIGAENLQCWQYQADTRKTGTRFSKQAASSVKLAPCVAPANRWRRLAWGRCRTPTSAGDDGELEPFFLHCTGCASVRLETERATARKDIFGCT